MKVISLEYLNKIKPRYIEKGYNIPKWIIFCEAMLSAGWLIKLDSAKTTKSKYVYIFKGHKKYKIRFSDHKANKNLENKNGSDFYVGFGNNGVLRTEELIKRLLSEEV